MQERVIQEIVNFFNHPFFMVIGGVTTIAMLATAIYILYLVIKGVIPIWYRLGRGLSAGKIAIFSTNEHTSLESMLIDAKIFKKQNIMNITTSSDIGRAEKSNILLVHWKDFQHYLPQILKIKKDRMALIIYAPQHEGRIEDQALVEINARRNSVIVNFRGRLLNDVVTSLITISYEWN